MFEILKRKKEDSAMTEDEKQINKAERDVEENGADSQTEKDRIDESVGEQERRDGDENSQNAKDRVDESEGAEKADEKREEEEDRDGFKKQLLAFMERVSSVLDRLEKNAQAAADADSEAAKRMEETYGVGNGVFQGENRTLPEKRITKEDVARTMSKIMK